MSGIQRLLKRLLPRSWGESMEAESRQWMLQCECGWEVSVWDVGGVRWKARGNPRQRGKCPRCGVTKWLRLYKK